MITISAHKPEFTKTENATRQARLLEKLLDVIKWDGSIRTAAGSYKGVEEECFVIKVTTDNPNRIMEIAAGICDLAIEFGQEAIGDINFDTNLFTTVNVAGDSRVYAIKKFITTPKTDYLCIDGVYYCPGEDLTKSFEVYNIFLSCSE